MQRFKFTLAASTSDCSRSSFGTMALATMTCTMTRVRSQLPLFTIHTHARCTCLRTSGTSTFVRSCFLLRRRRGKASFRSLICEVHLPARARYGCPGPSGAWEPNECPWSAWRCRRAKNKKMCPPGIEPGYVKATGEYSTDLPISQWSYGEKWRKIASEAR